MKVEAFVHGHHPLLLISYVLYFLSDLVMLWSPTVYVPVYILETIPLEIKGLLDALSQFTGRSCGVFLSYCMVFGMSLMEATWRLMFGISTASLLDENMNSAIKAHKDQI
uniref:Uncharacterized protein n=1 Tax=Populus trichocarpa TaxID=3694 RepID=A0A2K2BXE4_POPTR